MERLEPRVRTLWVLSALGSSTVIGVAFTLTATTLYGRFGSPDSRWMVLLPALLICCLTASWVGFAWYRYRRFRFDCRDESLYVEHGVLTHHKTVVPYNRLQHVDVRRRPLERVAGVATLVVHTAGTCRNQVQIPGLTPTRASMLQDHLRHLVTEKRDDGPR
ncbi:PH domain-containing protein [Halobacteria archaeon AArc-curdl1]|uniref:PH domain-containing protein n=1 Tax=Natronosalvus hydrolyticus TaxID=2979988 RepID=A0AAP2ZCL4_9EURY|nr:PH domain-containing protein [Halobacteria archaeon AArc-curdl1]